MTQWLVGTLEGTYVSSPVGAALSSASRSAGRYKMRIYRAQVRDIRLLGASEVENSSSAAASEAEHEATIYQASIDNARLIGLRGHPCLEGPLYEVELSDVSVTHSVKKDNRWYGRIRGQVKAQVSMPEETLAPLESLRPEAEPALKSSREPSTTAPRERMTEKAPGTEEEQAEAPGTDGRQAEHLDIEALHLPDTHTSYEERPPSDVPAFTMAILVGMALVASSGFLVALAWWVGWLPIAIIRLMLRGQFAVSERQKLLAAALVLLNLALLGWLGVDSYARGCLHVEMSLLALVGGSVLVSALLPSPFALSASSFSLGILLVVWSGNLGLHCGDTEKELRAPKPPSVQDPGKPRTNRDGSWPRREP